MKFEFEIATPLTIMEGGHNWKSTHERDGKITTHHNRRNL